MPQVTVHINRKPYVIGCDTGEEARLRRLAGELDARLRDLAAEASPAGETRLMLLGALMTADELETAREHLAQAERRAVELEARLAAADDRATAALDAAAARIESLAAR